MYGASDTTPERAVEIAKAHESRSWRDCYETWKDYVAAEVGCSQAHSYALVKWGQAVSAYDAGGGDPARRPSIRSSLGLGKSPRRETHNWLFRGMPLDRAYRRAVAIYPWLGGSQWDHVPPERIIEYAEMMAASPDPAATRRQLTDQCRTAPANQPSLKVAR